MQSKHSLMLLGGCLLALFPKAVQSCSGSVSEARETKIAHRMMVGMGSGCSESLIPSPYLWNIDLKDIELSRDDVRSKASILFRLREWARDFNKSYARRHTGADGAIIVLRFTLSPDGKVVNPRIEHSTLTKGSLIKDIRRTVQQRRFDTVSTKKGSVSVTLTMTFHKGVIPHAWISPPALSDLKLADTGIRSPESILRVIRAHVGGFRYSCEKYLRKNPTASGKISLRITIAPNGDVVAINVTSSSTGMPALDEEIKRKTQYMHFEPIEKGNVTVTYAFVLDRQ